MSYDATTIDPEAQSARRSVVVVGPDGVRDHELAEGGRLVVGRGLDADIRIDDPAVSRRHACLVAGPSVTLVVESRTGRARIDGREIPSGSSVVVEPGQLVEIGSSRLVLRRDREGAPRAIEATDRAVDLAAKSDLPVLVLGETGAGKEVMMERIVASSRRRGRPLVRVNCAALPETLLESELFGHEKGAFSGADKARPGLFEAADGGTAFLDEIAEVPDAIQAKLLRVIEGREVTRLGSAAPRSVDVRVIAATNRDVRARVSERTFREDLYFRLAGVVVTVPPLRERQDEIAAIARTILAAEAERTGRPAPQLGKAALALLTSYRWPGNARELKNVLARAILQANDVIEPVHLELLPPSPATKAKAAEPASPAAATIPPPPVVDDERARIAAALERAHGNQKEAAALLGITRRQLTYRLDAYGLPRPRKR